jgi:hypothetical protein
MVMTDGNPVVFVFLYIRMERQIANFEVHLPSILGLVCSNDGEKIVSLQKLARCVVPVKTAGGA